MIFLQANCLRPILLLFRRLKRRLALPGLVILICAISKPALANEDIIQSVAGCYELTDIQEKLACYEAVATQLPATTEEPEKASALEQRLQFEENIGANQFIIIPHKPNYILLYSYNHNLNPNPSSPTRETPAGTFEQLHSEAKFQISFKVQLIRNLMPEKTSLWFTYSQLSLWQVYNKSFSAPFRESVYEPELIFLYRQNFNLFGYSSDHILIGLNHQSNGRTEPLSRSWNRVYAAWIFSKGNLSLSLQPWWRLPESPDDDDNPDIDDYLGYGAVGATYKKGEDVYNLRLMNNLRREENRTSIQLSYSFALQGRLKGYIQYYNGYGESLLDYNHRVHRIGFGVLLTDWY